MGRILQFAVFIIFPFLLSCSKNEPVPETQSFEKAPLIRPVTALIEEASGIADSKANPGYMWIHEDGGNNAQLYLMGHDGKTAKSIFLKGVINRDWEDMVRSGDDLYIADIGDNNQAFASYTIYKFREPNANTDTISSFETIKYNYPDGAHDAEAFLVDPKSKDIYIVTKRDSPSRIYKIAYPYKSTTINTAELVGSLTFGGVVSASLAEDGRGIIIKTYAGLYYYSRTKEETIDQALQGKYTLLPYMMEPQGEAVTFSIHNNGYFTLSEKAYKDELNLYFYKTK